MLSDPTPGNDPAIQSIMNAGAGNATKVMNGLRRLLPYIDLMPALLAAGLMWHFTVETPWSDDWDLVPIIQKMQQGTLDWTTLDTPYAGHKLVVFYLVAGEAAIVSHWNSYLFRLLAFLAMTEGWLAIRPFAKKEGRLLEASIVYWSWSQWAMWAWTFTLSAGIAIGCALWALRLLRTNRYPHFTMAMVLAVLATFSQGVGIAVWPAAAYLMAFTPRPVSQRVIFGVVLIAAGFLFIYPPATGQLVRGKNYAEMPLYFLYALGGSVGVATKGVSALCGLLGLILLAFHFSAFKSKPFAAALVVTSLSMIGLVAIARGGVPPVFGGMDSRYGTMSALFWVGLILVCDWSGSRRYILAAILAASAIRSVTRIPAMELSARDEQAAREAVIESAPQRFHYLGAQTSPAQFDQDVKLMRQWHYSLFRDQ